MKTLEVIMNLHSRLLDEKMAANRCFKAIHKREVKARKVVRHREFLLGTAVSFLKYVLDNYKANVLENVEFLNKHVVMYTDIIQGLEEEKKKWGMSDEEDVSESMKDKTKETIIGMQLRLELISWLFNEENKAFDMLEMQESEGTRNG